MGSSRKRHGMYLSPQDDQQLVEMLDRSTVRGQKSELLRNYGLLGFQRALRLCAEQTDQVLLAQELAVLFAPKDSPPDFRSAAEFLRAFNAVGAKRTMPAARPAPAPAAPVAAPVAQAPAMPPEPPAAAPEQPSEQAAEPPAAPAKRDWGALKSLVGTQSKKEQG